MRAWSILWSVTKKDLHVWIRQPIILAATLLPSLGFIVVLFFYTTAVGHNPVALVMHDTGPHAQQLAQILKQSNAFIVRQKSSDVGAKQELSQLSVSAVITIPSSFDTAYDKHEPDPVIITINNLNLDFTNDLRRSLPEAINEFYERQSGSPIHIDVRERDLHQQDISLAQSQMVPILVLLLLIAGLINSGVATAREWEDKTIKELLLAPVPRFSLIAGKFLAGWLTTLVVCTIVLVIGAITGYIQPQGWYWLTTILIICLIALASAGLGVALGALLQKFLPVAVISINVALYLFFLSGGFGAAAFLPAWLQVIAHALPTFYGIHALQMAIFYQSTDLLGRDIAVLLGFALATMIVGILILRRGTIAH